MRIFALTRQFVRRHADAVTVRKLKALFGIEVPAGDGRFSLVFDVKVDAPSIDRRGKVHIAGEGAAQGILPVKSPGHTSGMR